MILEMTEKQKFFANKVQLTSDLTGLLRLTNGRADKTSFTIHFQWIIAVRTTNLGKWRFFFHITLYMSHIFKNVLFNVNPSFFIFARDIDICQTNP